MIEGRKEVIWKRRCFDRHKETPVIHLFLFYELFTAVYMIEESYVRVIRQERT